MNVEDIMNKICDIEYMNRTNFSKEFDLACSKKDKLKVLNLIVEKYDCNFEDAQAICDYFIDGKPLPNPDLTPQQIAQANAQAQELLNKPKCPTCGSTNIKKMGGIERGASIAAFGLFSKKINKTFKCCNCGYTW
jgi:hypothetical protein|nr:MAG TPA: Transcription factor S-II (TFIIS) [Bacteriophage sp.]